ncbi:hypothetical protein GCM10028803_48970 [Larkinella knui]|uniref:Uncharacterized protein n=1 Tax=Larkinella knui TaxID=2025310 RepID=A0A3P1CQ64_9BACT|nr:DUF6428 family protein [Larkinella knui]RRB15467.1 hypothetical protein EHT87_13155 [Larkinella knui]
MNNTESINWHTFKQALVQNPDKYLQFEYADGQFVEDSFHITEIKQAPITSVDCGGKMNAWTEIIVQLWEPSAPETDRSMKVGKALSIIDRVEKSLLLNPLATVKIEFGNSKFDTRQLYPGDMVTDGDAFTVRLTPDFTQCKALTRGQSCGIPAAKPVENEGTLVADDAICCAPGTGCC